MEQLIAYQRGDEIFSKIRKPVQMKGDEEVMIGDYDSAPELYGKLFSIGIKTSISSEDELELKGSGTTYIRTDPDDMLDFYSDPGQVPVIDPEKGDWNTENTIDNTLYADPEEWLDIKEKNADPDQWHPLI